MLTPIGNCGPDTKPIESLGATEVLSYRNTDLHICSRELRYWVDICFTAGRDKESFEGSWGTVKGACMHTSSN